MIDCNESKFALFREEPTIIQVKSMEERLSNIEFRQNGLQFSKEFDRISHYAMNNRRNRTRNGILIILN